MFPLSSGNYLNNPYFASVFRAGIFFALVTKNCRTAIQPDSIVIVYSDGPGCNLASQAVERLENLKLRNVYSYSEGIQGWQEAGYSLTPSPHAKIHTQGPVIECRQLVIDRETAYGGAFKGKPTDVAGAGG